MRVRVKLLFHEGKKLPPRAIPGAAYVIGDMAFGYVSKTSGGYSRGCLSLRQTDNQVAPTLVPDLWEPVLEGLGAYGMRFRGFERLPNGQVVVQAWLCEVAWN